MYHIERPASPRRSERAGDADDSPLHQPSMSLAAEGERDSLGFTKKNEPRLAVGRAMARNRARSLGRNAPTRAARHVAFATAPEQVAVPTPAPPKEWKQSSYLSSYSVMAQENGKPFIGKHTIEASRHSDPAKRKPALLSVEEVAILNQLAIPDARTRMFADLDKVLFPVGECPAPSLRVRCLMLRAREGLREGQTEEEMLAMLDSIAKGIEGLPDEAVAQAVAELSRGPAAGVSPRHF